MDPFKVIITTGSYDQGSRQSLNIDVSGVLSLDFCDGEPEDNSLCRNFNDCYSIGDALLLAHKAGQEGRTFVCEITAEEEEDE